MSMTEKDDCLCLGIINGSAKSFIRTYEKRETNVQIMIACISIFAYTIFQDFLRALWRTLRA